jgi:phage major head subunit gpT-like protein
MNHKGYVIEKGNRCYRVRGIRNGYDAMVGGADWETFSSNGFDQMAYEQQQPHYQAAFKKAWEALHEALP